MSQTVAAQDHLRICPHCFGQRYIYEPFCGDDGRRLGYLPVICETCEGTGKVDTHAST